MSNKDILSLLGIIFDAFGAFLLIFYSLKSPIDAEEWSEEKKKEEEAFNKFWNVRSYLDTLSEEEKRKLRIDKGRAMFGVVCLSIGIVFQIISILSIFLF